MTTRRPEGTVVDRGLAAASDSLLAVLTNQERDYAALVGVAEREERAIVESDVEALTELVDQQHLIAEHLSALETERMTSLVAIEAATGMPMSEATISEVASRLPAELGEPLLEQGMMLRAQALTLQSANERNAQLLQSSQGLIDRWVGYMRQLLTSSIYSADGSLGDVAGGRTLDLTG